MLRKLQSFPKTIPSLVEQKYFSGPKTFPTKTDEKSKRASCMDPKYTLLVFAWPGKVEGGPLSMTKDKHPPVPAVLPMFGASTDFQAGPSSRRYLPLQERTSVDTCHFRSALHRYLHRYRALPTFLQQTDGTSWVCPSLAFCDCVFHTTREVLQKG